MIHLFFQPEVTGSGLQNRGDNIPRHPAFGQVIERGELACQQIGVLVGGRERNAETELAGGGGHR